MGSPKTRRAWRRLYRMSRVYVPLVVLLLLAMVLYLPLSPDWLARKAETELRARTGLPVTLEGIRVRLAAAEVTLSGLSLEAENGGEPFTIEAVRLEGKLSELLAGSGRWPESVTVANPSPLRVVQDEIDGLLPEGALATLIGQFQRQTKDSPADEASSSPPASTEPHAFPPTPRVTIRNVQLAALPPSPDLPALKFAVHHVTIPERLGPGEALRAEFDGLMTLGSTEEITGKLTYMPLDERLELHATLSAFKEHVPIPGFGELDIKGDELHLEASLNRLKPDTVELRWDGELGRFQVAESRVGGERWEETNLSLTGKAQYRMVKPKIDGLDIRLMGKEIDLSLMGSLRPTGAWPGDLRLVALRLPSSVLRVAREEALHEGIRVDATTTSPTLQFDLEAHGVFARPEELRYAGTLNIAGWRVSQSDWKEPLEIRELSTLISNERFEINRFEVAIGGLEAMGTLNMPIPQNSDASELADVELSVRGRLGHAVALAKAEKLLPRQINDVTMPVALRLNASVPVALTAQGFELRPTLDQSVYSGELTWEAGEVFLRDLNQPIKLSSGNLAFSNHEVKLSHVNATYGGDVTLDIDLAMRSPEVEWTNRPAYTVSVLADGPIPSIMRLVGTQTVLPIASDTISGHARATIEADGVFGDWNVMDYRAGIQVEEVAAVFNIPYSKVHVDRLSAQIVATPERIEIPMLKARVEEAGNLEATGEISAEEIKLVADADTPLWVIESILPKDLQDLVMDGSARAKATVRLVPREELPEGSDVLRRWILAFAGEEPLRLGVLEDAPLRLLIDGRVYPADHVTFFHRDMPHEITDIRGDITADELGFFFHDVYATWGTSQNVKLNGRCTLGHIGPLKIDFDLEAPDLNLNDWMNGWSSRDWAERPFVRPPRRRNPGEERLMARIAGNIRLGKTEFLSVKAQNANVDLIFESWRGRRNTVDATVNEATTYGGTVTGDALVQLPQRHGEMSHFLAHINGKGVQMKGFLSDLRNQPEEFVGLFTGNATIEGDIGDYSTWTGKGEFFVDQSKFIGAQAMIRLASALNMGREQLEATTTIAGTATCRDETVFFPDMRVQNKNIRMLTEGSVDFHGAIDFLVTVDLFANQLEDILILSTVNKVLNELKNALVSLRVEGTIADPRVRTVPLQPFQVDRMKVLESSGSAIIKSSEETLKKSEKALKTGTSTITKGVQSVVNETKKKTNGKK